MKAAPFAYYAPESLQGAIGTLSEVEDAKALAGGQSLLPLMALRLAQPAALVDLRRIPGLAGIELEDGSIRLGAMTTQREAERSPVIHRRLPVLAEALSSVAHAPIRNRGTIGGSLAHADPAGELPALALALEATMELAGRDGVRSVAAADFFEGPFMTAIRSDEVLTSITVPCPRGRWAFMELAHRHGDFAIAMVAVGLDIEDGRCVWARIVFGGLAATPIRAPAGEDVLLGSSLRLDDLKAAANAAAAALTPTGDLHGSSAYRRHLACVLTVRALCRARDGGSA